MFHDILTNRWFLGGCGFLILLAIGCYFWYQHELEPYKQETTKARQQLEASQKAADAPQGDSAKTELAIGTVPESIDDSNSHKAASLEKADVPVSPHGFGPFPKVPDDYIIKPFSWDFYKNDPPIFELMARVRIKLWKQGIRTTGIGNSSATGLVYPTIPGTVFVKKYNLDGIDHLDIRGDPELDLEAIRKSLMDGNVPEGITVLDMDDAGIDPYTFLDLP